MPFFLPQPLQLALLERQAQPLGVGAGKDKGSCPLTPRTRGPCGGREMRKGLYRHAAGSQAQGPCLVPTVAQGTLGQAQGPSRWPKSQWEDRASGGDKVVTVRDPGRETPCTHSRGRKGLRTL